jgi:hypothetical protein
LVDGVREADEDNPRGYFEFEPVKKTGRAHDWLPAARGKAVKIIYRLLYDLPPGYEYRVIFMQRDMHEVLASQRKMLERQGTTGSTLSDEQLGAAFHKELERIRMWLAGQASFAVREVDYNAMFADVRPQVKTINDFLGGNLDLGAMSAVVDASLYRNRR